VYRISAIAIILLVVCAGFIQVGAFDYIEIAGIKPDLLLVIVIYISLACQGPETIKAAITAGIIKDVTSSAVFGSYVLSFLALGLLLNYHQRRFYKERIPAQMMFGLCSYIFVAIFVFGINLIAQRGIGPFYPFFDVAIKGALYTGFISPLVFFTASRVLRIRLAHVI